MVARKNMKFASDYERFASEFKSTIFATHRKSEEMVARKNMKFASDYERFASDLLKIGENNIQNSVR